ncbi:uncharacterized protein LOC129958925 [Argiope bruennichi]|uniref:SUMO-specific isopeptidase USPL1 like protein n=1 Tax=Argiope bruennichi TaxID=94029 RepID=A0A8T0F7J9_ARGBR|nr:uncharacterized protein LOC129958925 [Argiope bruennichi]XP_055927644.1 uncharacterized protein LOC129958925 [Argiope bruennichi]KAF8784973.1 SUMO-specific isopeptidase USPL1 like protein [Argiope bruennichi]
MNNNQRNEILTRRYASNYFHLNFQNNSNLCWLNSSMSLLAYNKSLLPFVNDYSTKAATIIKGYESAISVYNDRFNESTMEEKLQKAKQIMQKIQDIVLQYLKPILKYKEGQPDSAFCALLNLIKENEQIKNLFLVKYASIRNCKKCLFSQVMDSEKTIITLPKVRAFKPDSLVSLYKCHICGALDEELEIKYKTLPQCLIFHFENGVGERWIENGVGVGERFRVPLEFNLNNRTYELSGLIEFRKGGINHFVTWIRDILSNQWLERNDLESDILSFRKKLPGIALQDFYIVMYEALDNKGSVSVDAANISRVDLDDTSSYIPIIDLSDDEEEFDKNNQTEKNASNLPLMGSLPKYDETYSYSNNKEMLKRPDEIFSDRISVTQSVLESLTKIKLSEEFPKNEGQMDVFSKSINNNSQHNDKNEFKEQNIKQSLLKDSIVVHKRDEGKSFVFHNTEIASFAKPALENNVKTSKGNSGKTLVRTTSSIEILEIQTNIKDNSFGKKDIPSAFAENFLGGDHTISSSKNDAILTKNPVAYQDNNVLIEESNDLNMKEPINAAEDESSANDAVSTCPKKLMKKFASKYEEIVVEKTKPVAVKKKKTYSKSILKRKAGKTNYLKTKVRRVETVRKRLRKIKMPCSVCNECANTTGKAKVKTVSKRTFKTENIRKKYKTHTTTKVYSGVSSIGSQKTTKKKLSDDINAGNDAKAGNSDPPNECSSGLTNKNLNSGYDVAGDTIHKRPRKMTRCRFCSDDSKVETVQRKAKRAT